MDPHAACLTLADHNAIRRDRVQNPTPPDIMTSDQTNSSKNYHPNNRLSLQGRPDTPQLAVDVLRSPDHKIPLVNLNQPAVVAVNLLLLRLHKVVHEQRQLLGQVLLLPKIG